MPNLTDMYNEIKDELNKGETITFTQIASKIRDALLIIESSNNWAYMDRFVQFTVDLDAENPRALPMPSRAKKIEFVRFVKSDGCYAPLIEASPKDFSRLETGMADAYWKDGMEYIWLNKTPEEAYVGEMSYLQFTEFSYNGTWEPWPMKFMYSLIKYQALVMLAPFVREPELMKMHAVLYEQAFKAAVDMNEELEYGNQPMSMRYS